MIKYMFLIVWLMGLVFFTQAQQPNELKLPEVFFNFTKERMGLTGEEAVLMRPLVIKYFTQTRIIHRNNPDPLLRDQKKIYLKLQFRNRFIPIIGERRANQFFEEERLFRRKIKEELQERTGNN